MGKLVVFDLDGTLVDSRLDLAGAVNYVRSTLNLEMLETERIVSFVGNGQEMLVRRAVGDAEIDFDEALKRFKSYYADHLLETTSLYPGAKAALKGLASQGAIMAVLSNKPEAACRKILSGLGIEEFFHLVIGGGGDYPLKPAPDALIAMRSFYGIANDNCWMVGDHCTDLEAGRRAGFRTIFMKNGMGHKNQETPEFEAADFAEFSAIIMGF